MHVLGSLKGAIRRRRTFDACQWAGFSLILIAVSIWVHPVSIVFTWFNQWMGLHLPLTVWIAFFGVFGWVLAWQHSLSHAGFVFLTLPILVFAVTQILFALNTSGAGYSSGVSTGILYGWMQWAHARQEAHRAFMREM